MEVVFLYAMLCAVAAFVGAGIGVFSWFLGFALGLKYTENWEPTASYGQLLSRWGFWIVERYQKAEIKSQQWVSDRLMKLEKPTPDDSRRLQAQRPINLWKAFICPICRATHLANLASVFVVVGLLWNGQSLWLGACFWLVCASSSLFASQAVGHD